MRGCVTFPPSPTSEPLSFSFLSSLSSLAPPFAPPAEVRSPKLLSLGAFDSLLLSAPAPSFPFAAAEADPPLLSLSPPSLSFFLSSLSSPPPLVLSSLFFASASASACLALRLASSSLTPA